MGKTLAQQSVIKGGSAHRESEAVVDLSMLSFAEEKPSIAWPEEEGGPPRVIKPGLQLLFRTIFTLLATGYFLFNTKEPLFLNLFAIVGLAGALLVTFFLFHFLLKRREFFFRNIPLAALLDVAACSVAWLCDPWEPAPMMLFILITAVGNGANYGYKCIRSLLNIIAPVVLAIYLIRLAETQFSPTALLFLALSIFLLIYTCILIRHIDHLQLWAGEKATEFEESNKSLQKIGDALQESESRYKNMFEHSGTPTILLEENMMISIVNSKFEQLTGYAKGELCNKKRLTDFIHKDDLERIKRFHIRRRAMGDTAPTEYECQLIDKSQKIKHVIIRLSVAQWHERIIATLVDITSRKQAKAALQQYNIRLQQVARKLKESELRYRSLFENTGTATILVEKNMRITMANSQFCEMTGYSRLEIKDRIRLTEFIERQNLARIRRYHAIQASRGLPPPSEYELIFIGRHRMNKHVVMKAYKPPGQESTIVSFFDITSRKEAEAALAKAHEKLQAMAVSDELTQVANRRRFDEYLRQEWDRHKREGLPLGIIMSDVDSFKLYNDTYGHQAGDECLRSVASAIKTAIKRSVDLVARYGGEEFVIIMPNTDVDGAMLVAENVRAGVESLKIIHEKSRASKYVTLSIGVASMIPEANLPPERLVRAADIALYEAKDKGRNRTMAAAKKGKGFIQRPAREDNVIKIS
ncbi:MAG: diguanylate cyclase [Deltaproteobacteria bacterium]|nr:diguanylate cyclase [Deltaproteobacteria bacterium]